MKTEGRVEVVRIVNPQPHPNADSLDLVLIYGYPCIIKRGSFKDGDLAAYVPVDSVVPLDRPEFAFLKKERIRAIRLRGIFSMGLLVAAPPEALEGDDVTDVMGVVRYVPPSERVMESTDKAPKRSPRNPEWMPIYGLEAVRRNPGVLQAGEAVVITEKIHGCNARYCYRDGKLYVGSHKMMRGTTQHRVLELLNRAWLWMKGTVLGQKHRAGLMQRAGDVWWQVAQEYNLEEKLRTLAPGITIYGEIYGESVQDMTYDSPKGRKFLLFDALDTKTGRYLEWDELLTLSLRLGIPTVPVLHDGPWDPVLGAAMAEGLTTVPGAPAGHIREGVVVKASPERLDPLCGRVALKLVGQGYMLRSES